MKNKREIETYVIQAAAAVGFILCVLKLTDALDWSWWWITFPFWIAPATITFTFLFMVFINLLSLIVADVTTFIQRMQSR